MAGHIEAVGRDVVGLRPGDRVLAAVQGGFAERVVTKAADATAIPDALSFAQAAGFRINYLTALHGLRDRAALAEGERLLVIGAAGGVGMAALQVGRCLGARVVACASSEEKRAFAQAQGAHCVIDAAPEGWRERLKGAMDGAGPDVVFDPVSGPLMQPAFRSQNWRGRYLVVGFAQGQIPALPVNLPLLKGAALIGVDVRQFQIFEAERTQAHLRQLLGWVAEGSMSPPVGRTFRFEAFAEALEFALTGQGLGKTVLRISGDDA